MGLDFPELFLGLIDLTLEVLRAVCPDATERADGRHGVERLTGPGHVGLKLGAVAAVVVALVLAFARGEFRVAANASLEPVARQAAVAPFNGYIAQAPARAGDVVRREQLLAMLAGGFQAPLTKAAGLFQAFTRNFAYGVRALIDQKESGPSEPSEQSTEHEE